MCSKKQKSTQGFSPLPAASSFEIYLYLMKSVAPSWHLRNFSLKGALFSECLTGFWTVGKELCTQLSPSMFLGTTGRLLCHFSFYDNCMRYRCKISTDEETEAQRCEVSCPGPHGWWICSRAGIRVSGLTVAPDHLEHDFSLRILEFFSKQQGALDYDQQLDIWEKTFSSWEHTEEL